MPNDETPLDKAARPATPRAGADVRVPLFRSARPRGSRTRFELWIPAAYLVFSAIWIVGTDTLVGALASSPEQAVAWSVYKGLAFIATTAALIYAGLRWALASEIAALKRVAESEHLLRTLTDALPEPLVLKDRGGRWRFANPAACELVGRPLDAILGKTDDELSEDAALAEKNRASDEVVMATGTPESTEISLTVRGEHRIFLAQKAPLRDADGTVVGVVGSARDVTAHHEAEQRFRSAFEQAAAGVAIVDSVTGVFVEVNDRLCEILGYTRDELLTLRWEAVTHPDHVAYDQAILAEVLGAEAGSRTWTKRYRRKDGRDVWVQIALSKMLRQRRAQQIAVVQDISPQIEAEEAARRSDRRLGALIEKSEDIILVVDAGGHVTFTSPSAERTLGWTEAETKVDGALLELVHPDDRRAVVESSAALLAEPGGSAQQVVRIATKDGEHRVVEVRAHNLIGDAIVQGVVLNGRDVTENKHLEEQFHQAQRLESVGRLAGGIAHDFNNLLTVILGAASSLEEDLPRGEADPEEVAQIAGAARRAADLTRQLLAFARKQIVAPVRVDLSRVITSCDRMLRRLLGEDVRVVVRCDTRPCWVLADPGQLEQVVVNLAVNARDAMPDGGELEIASGWVDLDEGEVIGAPTGRYVELQVRDSGQGMSAEVRAHAFEPFFTTKEVGRGTGLGLATVHGIVHQAQGAVTLESEPGEGTTFRIYLPRLEADGAQTATRSHAPTDLRGHETVLVVEDDAHVRAATVRALQSVGYRVLVAASGEQAIAIASAERGAIDLVITDVVMPGLNGRATADELRKARPELRVLYVSGYTHDVISERGALGPQTLFLAKPFTPKALQLKVRSVFEAQPAQPGGGAQR